MLNLHKTVERGSRLERIFQDLKRKLEGDYIYGRMFISETIIEIVDTLDMLIFHLNALTGGNDIDLFYKLDSLKTGLNSSFINSADTKKKPPATDASTGRGDALSTLLAEIIDQTAKVSASADATLFSSLDDVSTAHDLLNLCYYRLFEILDDCHRSIYSATGDVSARTIPIIGVPLSYLQQDEKPPPERGITFNKIPDSENSNPGAFKLGEGFEELLISELYAPYLIQLGENINNNGVLFYANETLALYYISDRFKNIITANICDAVGGNYINLLISSNAPQSTVMSTQKLIRKLLDWLDFYTYSSHGFTTASINNITRNEMENHLNMLAKLLIFASNSRIEPLDDEKVQQDVEIFLESIV
jgi:hypothetical protein